MMNVFPKFSDLRSATPLVVAGLDPAIHLLRKTLSKDDGPGSSPGMTTECVRSILQQNFVKFS
jgi:hypothetical protein